MKFFIAFLWEGGFSWDEMLDEYLGTKIMNPVTNYIDGRMENKFLWDFLVDEYMDENMDGPACMKWSIVGQNGNCRVVLVVTKWAVP